MCNLHKKRIKNQKDKGKIHEKQAEKSPLKPEKSMIDIEFLQD